MAATKELKNTDSMTNQKVEFEPLKPGKAGMYVCGTATKELKITDSMTNQKVEFKTLEPGKVGMYVCGVTAYALSHIGHARAAVNFDILYRYLKHLGYEVVYVRNFTDVDDKIILRANESGEDPLSLSNRFCEEYLVDMDDLQCLRPTHQPRVSEHMEDIKNMITQIIDNGYAYQVEGDVFYAVDKYPKYGCLSGRKVEQNRAGERVSVDERKRNPADFALWKAAKPGEPRWDSPWGPGRPGWHIECSAMSAYYLTSKFDIHGGGIDLIFPHHENEIAQSCAACKDGNISYWMHNGHVMNNNEKMSKSMGNFFTIREVTEKYHPLALRHFLISAHYRSPLNYTVSQLEASSEFLFYIFQTLRDCEAALLRFQEEGLKEGMGQKITPEAKQCITKLHDEFETKLSDDLNTSHVLTGAFQEALKFINTTAKAFKKKQQRPRLLSLIQSLTEIEKEVKMVLDILGLLPPCTYAEVLKQLKEKALKRAGLVEADVLSEIEKRTAARKNKDYATSDKIRIELEAKGVKLMDEGEETDWRPCARVLDEEEAAPAGAPGAKGDAPPVGGDQNSTPSI